ncbi:hypothetical protein [Nitrosomonas sp. Nm34]|uniref:hypothetical protein n=1 Tax=Nitrosomonas sp. Nm34 TaxID=1881055 RepID=UPI0008EC57B1|nr:hypothetical protein [Nitrosomonas sp. Nm34]SFI63919.1 hypothetical protein SAMN05428978_102210 [Nitrosomonas sp. Nm34]
MSYSGAAEEISFSSIAPYALHILLAGIWFGALPAFLFIIYDSLRALLSIKCSISEDIFCDCFACDAADNSNGFNSGRLYGDNLLARIGC